MKKYPIREPFLNGEYGDMLYRYRKYCQELYQNQSSIDDTKESLKDIYTPLTLKRGDKSYGLEEAILSSQFLSISGLAGSGKSTITKYLSLILVQNGINDSIKMLGKRIVMPIILRELNFGKIHSLDDLFDSWIRRVNNNNEKQPFTREFFDFYIENGWVIMVFDGFDEIGVEQNKNLINWLNSYIDQNRLDKQELKSNIIITGRPTGFVKGGNYDKYLHRYEIEPYSDKQIAEFAKKYFQIRYSPDKNRVDEKTENFLNTLHNADNINELSSRPIYLMMLTFIYDKKGEFPRTRIYAYQLMVEAYIHYLDKEKDLKTTDDMPDWDFSDKVIMLEELAYKIHTKAGKIKKKSWETSQMQIQISKKELKQYLKEIIKDSRLKSVDENENIDRVIEYFLGRTGLIEEAKEGFIQFSHLSFQEYLSASRIYRKVPKRKIEDYLKRELFDKLGTVGWSEIALLYYGIDSLKQGEGQSEQIKFLFDAINPAHHKFIVDLITNTENRFSQEEKDRWLHSLLHYWLRSENIYDFEKSIRNFGEIKYKKLLEDEEGDSSDFVKILKDIPTPKYYIYYRNNLYLKTVAKQNITLKIKKPITKAIYIEPQMLTRRLGNAQQIEIGKYQATFDEYDKFFEDTGIKKPSDSGWGRGKRPVINVSWIDAKTYCRWLSDKSGKEYRLPTSDEWEEIAKNGKDTIWGFGDDESLLKDYAWYRKNSDNKTHKVGERKPINGIYDMHGNVWEWCEDWYDESKNSKILRGGSWVNDADGSRSAFRFRFYPSYRYNSFGFRLLRTLPS